MNWLAHLHLSKPTVECRLGNLLADIVKGEERSYLTPGVWKGILCHQFIDSFTDFHPIVERSKILVPDSHRRFGGIIMDVFYDHLLAKNWDLYSDISLARFSQEIYQSFQDYPGPLPGMSRWVITRMSEEDLLGSYASPEGVERALLGISKRLSHRLNRPICLNHSVRTLQKDYNILQDDFLEFYPELTHQVHRWWQTEDQST